jgi:hypothetical protein
MAQTRTDGLTYAQAGVDIDAVKEDSGVRSDMKTKLDAMLKQYEW